MKRYLGEIKVIAHRVLLEQIRLRRSIIFWIVFPTLMLLLFGLIYAGGGQTASSFDTTAPGILIGAALFFSCMGGPVSLVVAERERRTLRRLLLSPLSPSSYFLGIFLAYLVIAMGQAIIVYGIAFCFGGRFHGSPPLGILIVALSVFSFVGMGFFFGARLTKRTEDVNGPIAAFGVPLLVLGGTFFSVRILPPFLFKLTQLNPIFHMNQALIRVSAFGDGVMEIKTHLIFLSAFTIISLLLGSYSYRLMLTTEKRG